MNYGCGISPHIVHLIFLNVKVRHLNIVTMLEL